MMVSEKEIQKEMNEHPWADRKIARRIAQDHARRKTTTKEGKRVYQRDYMRRRREQLKMLSPSAALGFQGSGQNLANLLSGKKGRR